MKNEEQREIVNTLWATLEGLEHGRRSGWLAYGVGNGWLTIRIPVKSVYVQALTNTLEYGLAAQEKDKIKDAINEMLDSVTKAKLGKPRITYNQGEDEFRLVYDFITSQYIDLCEKLNP